MNWLPCAALAAVLTVGVSHAAPPEPLAAVPEKRPARQLPFPAIQNWTSLAITLVRHPCPLICPSYRLTVHGDGRVDYEGTDGDAVKGVHHASIPAYKTKLLFEHFRAAEFFWTDDAYQEPVMDGIAVDIAISFDGHSKTVRDYDGDRAGMPRAVQALEADIDRIAGVARWTKGNSETAAALVAEGWDFTSTACTNKMLLTGVAAHGDADALKDLIELRAPRGLAVQELGTACQQPPYNFEDLQMPALMHAAERGESLMVQALLSYEPGTGEAELRGALSSAAQSGNAETIGLVTEALLHLTGKTKIDRAETALYNAASVCSPAAVRDLLEHADHPNLNGYRGESGGTILHAAADHDASLQPNQGEPDCGETVMRLIRAGAAPDARDEEGNTPLMRNSIDPAVTWAFLKAGADPNAQNNNGETALMHFVTEDVEIMLLEAGADPMRKDKSGQTLFDRAKSDTLLAEQADTARTWLAKHARH